MDSPFLIVNCCQFAICTFAAVFHLFIVRSLFFSHQWEILITWLLIIRLFTISQKHSMTKTLFSCIKKSAESSVFWSLTHTGITVGPWPLLYWFWLYLFYLFVVSSSTLNKWRHALFNIQHYACSSTALYSYTSLHVRVITLLWLILHQFVFSETLCTLKAVQLKWCQFMSCSRVKHFIYPTLVKPWEQLIAISGWLELLVQHHLNCWLGNTDETSVHVHSRTFHTLLCKHKPLRRGANRCVHMQYSMWQNGMSAIQTVHKLQLWKLKISTGWVGFLCQRRTFSVGRWMMEEKGMGWRV